MHDYRLHVFRIVAERLNFTRAAGELHISQPAVTQHIKQLEEHYGRPLFVRGPGGVSLTGAGRVLLEHVSRVEELHAAMERRLREADPVVSGPLRLGASTTIAQYLLPGSLGRFRQAHPRVELSLRMDNTEAVATALLAGSIDLGLIEGPCGRRELKSERFAEDELVPVAAPGHPLAARAAVTVAELGAEPWILREPGSGTRDVVARAWRRAGFDPRGLQVIFESDSSETIKGLVETGVGLAFMSRLALRRELLLGTLAVIPVPKLRVVRPLFFLRPQGPRPAGPAGAFMEFLREALPAGGVDLPG